MLEVIKIVWACWALISTGNLLLHGARVAFQWDDPLERTAERVVASFLVSSFVLLAGPVLMSFLGLPAVGAFHSAFFWLAVPGTGLLFLPVIKKIQQGWRPSLPEILPLRVRTFLIGTVIALVVFLVGLLTVFGTVYPKMNWDGTNFYLPVAMQIVQNDEIPRVYPEEYYPLETPVVPISYNFSLFLSYFLSSSDLLDSDLDVVHFLDKTNFVLGIVPVFLLMIWSLVIFLYARLVLRTRFGAWLAVLIALSMPLLFEYFLLTPLYTDMLFSALLTAFAYHTTKYILYRRRIDIALAAVALPVVALTKVTGLFLALGVAALSLVVLRGWGARTFAFLLFGSIAGFWFLKTQVVQDDWLTPAISAKPAAFLIFALAASGAVALWKGRLPGGLFPGPTRLRPNWSLRSTWRVLLVLWPLLIIAIPYFWYIQDTGTPLSYSLPFTQVGLGATESELWAEELYSAAGLSQLTTFAAPGTPHNLPFAIITDFRILPGLAPLVFLGLIVGLLGRRSSLWRLNALLVIFAYVSWILLFEMRVPRHYLFIAPFLATGAAMGLMAAVTAFNQRNTGKASVAALVLVGALVVSLPYQFVTFSYLSFLDFPESFFSFLGTARDWFSGSHLKAGFRVQAEATTGMLVVLIGTILARRYLIARFIEIHFPRGLPFSVSFNFGSITLFLTAGAAIIVIVALSVPQVRFLADHPRTELVEKAFGETYHRGELKALEVARLRSIDNGERSTLVSFYGWGVEYGTRGTLRNVILSDFRQMAQLRPYFTGETNGRLEDIVSGAKGDVIYLLPSLSTGHGRILADIASQLPTDRLIDLYNPAYYKQEFATSGWTLSSPTDFKLKVGEVTSMSSSIGTGVLSAKSTGTNVIQADPVDGSITFASAEVADYGFLRYALSPGTDGRVLNLNFGLDLLEPPVGFQLLLVQDEADATVLALRLNGEILSISAQGLTEKTELEDAGNTIDLTVSQIQNNTLTRLKINGREFIATGGGEPIARVFVGDTSSRVGVGTIKLTSPSIRTDLLLLTEGGS